MDRCPISCRQRIRQHCDRARRVGDIAQHGSRFDEYASLTEQHDCCPDGVLARRHDDAQLVRLHFSSSDGPTLRRPPSHAFSSHMKMARSKYGLADYRRQSGTLGSRPRSRKPSINSETGEESEHADTVQQRAPALALNVAGLESSCFGKSAVRTPRISKESVGASQASLHGLVSAEGISGGLSICGRSDMSLQQRKKSKRSSRKFSCMSSADVLPTLTTFAPGTRHPLQAHIAPRLGEIQLDRCFSTRDNSLTSSSNHNVDASNTVSSFAEVELLPLPASDAGNWSTLRLDANDFDSTVAIAADVPENSDLAQVMVNDAENERKRNNPQPSFRSSAGAASHAYTVDDVQRLTLTSGRDISVAMDSRYYRRTSLDSRSSPPSTRNRAGCINAAVLSNPASPPTPPSSAASRNARMPVLHENTCDQTSSSSSSCTISPDFRHNFGFSSYSNTFDSPNLGTVYSPEYYFHGRAARASHYWPFRRLPLHSYEETRNYFAASEILSARERVERDAISYEQMFMLEANLLLGGMSSYDQHQDLRLDIDSMSYEELLALEDSMGYVCTGLEKHIISECLKIDKYRKISLAATGPVPDCIEVKCSICQEDFEEGLDLGTLQCGHKHHFSCIEQWLQRKNECPICKKPAFLNRTT